MNIDRDLQSIQEVRDLVAKAKEAEKTLCTFPQEKLDAICASIASACMDSSNFKVMCCKKLYKLI